MRPLGLSASLVPTLSVRVPAADQFVSFSFFLLSFRFFLLLPPFFVFPLLALFLLPSLSSFFFLLSLSSPRFLSSFFPFFFLLSFFLLSFFFLRGWFLGGRFHPFPFFTMHFLNGGSLFPLLGAFSFPPSFAALPSDLAA